MPDEREEVARIESVYEGYATDARVRRRWSPDNPGNIRIERERESVVRTLLDEAGLWPPVGYRILDLGCGAGAVLRRFIGWGTEVRDAVGVDLLEDRLANTAGEPNRPLLARADGACLPFGEASFRLVIAFTVFSSILDDDIARSVAAEINRVLEPGGSVVWYDFRVRNPWNPHTRGMNRARVTRLFPAYRAHLRSVTLVPQIARRLGPLTRSFYPALATLPFVRTHYAGVLTKA